MSIFINFWANPQNHLNRQRNQLLNQPFDFKTFHDKKILSLKNCHNIWMQKRNNSQWKFGFPYSQHILEKPTLNNVSNRWEYYRPKYANHNVVAYHPTLLLLWGAHMNML
jgi:hypothetical protein